MLPDLGLQQNRPRLAALAVDGNLTAFLARHSVAPFQAADLADAGAGDIEQLEQNAVAAFRSGVDQAGDFALFQNALGQVVAVGPGLDGGPDIERQVAGLLGEGQQGLDGRERPVLGGRFATSLPQVLRPGLQVGQGHPGQRLGHEGPKAGGIGSVGAAGMDTGLHGKPQRDQWGVLGAVGGRAETGGGHDGELVHWGSG